MSKNEKILCALIISLFLVVSVTDAGARMAASAVSVTGATPGQNQVTKSSQFVKKITDSTLYLEGNKSYDLTDVNVIDLTGKSRVSAAKKLAEMTFVNGVLKEVILR